MTDDVIVTSPSHYDVIAINIPILSVTKNVDEKKNVISSKNEDESDFNNGMDACNYMKFHDSEKIG